MAMPVLDPERFVFARLVNPNHMLPIPGSKRFFSATEPEQIDSHDPYWRLPLADGSLKRVPPPPPPAPAAHAASAAVDSSAADILEQMAIEAAGKAPPIDEQPPADAA